jgi:hypothetical protein
MFIRGSVVRYVMLPRSEVDVGLLEDATRRGELRPLSQLSSGNLTSFSLVSHKDHNGLWTRVLSEPTLICSYRGRQPGWQSSVNDTDPKFTINHASRSFNTVVATGWSSVNTTILCPRACGLHVVSQQPDDLSDGRGDRIRQRRYPKIRYHLIVSTVQTGT